MWDPQKDKWAANYQKLKVFFEKHGHSNCPSNTSDLSKWVSAQRNNKKKNLLSQERIKLLNDLNIIWDLREFDWESKFKELKEFVKKHGRANPSRKESPILGQWIQTQRLNYKNGQLSKEKIHLFEKFEGWKWDGKPTWHTRFEELKNYVLENGHACPPTKSSALGQWVGIQRTKYNKNLLSKEEINLLENLNGWKWNGKRK